MPRPSIPEFLLQHIWEGREQFLVPSLVLSDGTSVQILDTGTRNSHRGGPDFLDARIAIDGVVLSGNIELHRTADLWHEHGHDTDTRYSKVILHVVLEDEEGSDVDASPRIPLLSVRENLRYDHTDLWRALFEKVYDRAPELPCFPQNIRLRVKYKKKVVDSFGEARLNELVSRFSEHRATEEQLLDRVYELSLDALGYSQNRVPFGEIARMLPRSLLISLRESTAANAASFYEALFFGAAGLLPLPSIEFSAEANEYITELRAKWEAINVMKSIPVLGEGDWAFFRIRPLNSPWRRIALAAQLAATVFSLKDWSLNHPFFSDDFSSAGFSIELGSSPFWESRTSFKQALESPQQLLGDERRQAIWLNVILPARIAAQEAGIHLGHSSIKQLRNQWGNTTSESSARYINTIEQELLESENVKTVRSEQGSLFLERNFCRERRCGECPIGNRLIEKGWKL